MPEATGQFPHFLYPSNSSSLQPGAPDSYIRLKPAPSASPAARPTSSSARSTIPVRPRTPLRFGSVPTPMYTNTPECNSRPLRNLHPSLQNDSITCILSQESYFDMPEPSSISYPSSTASSNYPVSNYSDESISSPPSPSFSSTASPTCEQPPLYKCKFPTCIYSELGFTSARDLAQHLTEGIHFSPGAEGYEPDVYGGGWRDPGAFQMKYPGQSQEQCGCNFCCTPLHTAQQKAAAAYLETMDQLQYCRTGTRSECDGWVPEGGMVRYAENWLQDPWLVQGEFGGLAAGLPEGAYVAERPRTKRVRSCY